MNVEMTTNLTNGSSVITGMVRKQFSSQNPVVSDKIQAPAVGITQNHFAPAANHAANEFLLWELLETILYIKKVWTSGGFLVGTSEHVKLM